MYGNPTYVEEDKAVSIVTMMQHVKMKTAYRVLKWRFCREEGLAAKTSG